MSALLNFAMKKTTFWLLPNAASHNFTTPPRGPSRRLAFGPPTMTSVAFGFNTRLHADHDLLPATSSMRS